MARIPRERGNDIHLDELSPALDRRNWLSSAASVLREAWRIVQDRTDVTVAVGIDLSAAADRTGVDWSDPDSFRARLMATPPSLYVFSAGEVPWADDHCASPSTILPPSEGLWRAFFCEWYHDLGGVPSG